MESELIVPLTNMERLAVQLIAASNRMSHRRGTIGVPPDEVRRALRITSDAELDQFIARANQVLVRETVPSKLVWDRDANRCYYLATIAPRQILERFTPRTLALFMFIYYLQAVVGRRFTTIKQILTDVVRSTDTQGQGPHRQVRLAIEPLVEHYFLVEKRDETSGEEGYVLTAPGRVFLSDHLLQHMTALVMDRHYDAGTIMDFFKRNLKSETGRPQPSQLNFILEAPPSA